MPRVRRAPAVDPRLRHGRAQLEAAHVHRFNRRVPQPVPAEHRAAALPPRRRPHCHSVGRRHPIDGRNVRGRLAEQPRQLRQRPHAHVGLRLRALSIIRPPRRQLIHRGQGLTLTGQVLEPHLAAREAACHAALFILSAIIRDAPRHARGRVHRVSNALRAAPAMAHLRALHRRTNLRTAVLWLPRLGTHQRRRRRQRQLFIMVQRRRERRARFDRREHDSDAQGLAAAVAW